MSQTSIELTNASVDAAMQVMRNNPDHGLRAPLSPSHAARLGPVATDGKPKK
jgi:hypothetical protein